MRWWRWRMVRMVRWQDANNAEAVEVMDPCFQEYPYGGGA
jgi:hypothetical protein